jgi:hypothetical protein
MAFKARKFKVEVQVCPISSLGVNDPRCLVEHNPRHLPCAHARWAEAVDGVERQFKE